MELGVEQEQIVETGALLALAGLDVHRFLEDSDVDALALTLWSAIAVRASELRELERIDLARRIRQEIAEMLGG